MTTVQIIACAIACLAAITAVAGAISSYRTAREARARNRTFTVPSGGEVTVTAPMSDADYEALKARWLETYGKPGTAHPVDVIDEEEQP